MSAVDETAAFLEALYDRAKAKGNARMAERIADLVARLISETDETYARLEWSQSTVADLGDKCRQLRQRLAVQDRQLEQLRQPKAMR